MNFFNRWSDLFFVMIKTVVHVGSSSWVLTVRMQYLSMVIFVLILLWNLQILRAEILLWQATNCAATIMLKKMAYRFVIFTMLVTWYLCWLLLSVSIDSSAMCSLEILCIFFFEVKDPMYWMGQYPVMNISRSIAMLCKVDTVVFMGLEY
jgi:hypothetical protein